MLLIPSMTTDRRRRVPRRRHHGRLLRAPAGLAADRPVRIGKRAFLGNSGMAAPGTGARATVWSRVLSAAPAQGQARLVVARVARRCGCGGVGEGDESPHLPARRRGCRVARALWELCRIVPVFVTCAIGLARAVRLGTRSPTRWGLSATVLLSGAVLLVAGAVAAAVSTVGQVGARRADPRGRAPAVVARSSGAPRCRTPSPRWSPRRGSPGRPPGTPALAVWLRSLGAQIGRGVWCDSYWLPEADLVTLGDGATVNRGCVVQTHLFHDRIMSMDTVELEAGATLGPHSVILPGGHDRRACHGRSGVARHARRDRAGRAPLERQPHRAVASRQGAQLPVDVVTTHPRRLRPAERGPDVRRRGATNSTLTTGSARTGSRAER